jgi:hypothetical protein
MLELVQQRLIGRDARWRGGRRPANRRWGVCILMSGLCCVPTVETVAASTFPLLVAENRRHLTGHDGSPFLIHADTPWSLFVALTREETEQYMEDRRAKGFNTLIANLIEHAYPGAANPYGAPTNRYGDAPFSTPGDFSTPNEDYFAHADWVINLAAEKGLVLLLTPCYLGYPNTSEGWYNEVLANGNERCREYGRYLGSRYANRPNLLWMMGGDRNPDDARSMVEAMIAGIREFDTNHLATAHCIRFSSARSQYPNSAWLDFDTVYPRPTNVVQECLKAYRQNPPLPVLMIEGWYEGENRMTTLSLRRQAYWANLSGACGQAFGNRPIWLFDTGWQTALDSPGSGSMVHVRALFESRPWWALEPDDAHEVVTAGIGTGNSYVAAARANHGGTVMAYLPAGGTITVNLDQLSGATTRAWWFNPRDGTATNFGTFESTGSQEFSAPSSEDWVLVLDDEAQGYPPPGGALPAPLEITTSTLSNAQVGRSFSQTLTASGGVGVYSWRLTAGALPAGLVLRTSGSIRGTPTEHGVFTFTVRVTDGAQTTASKELSLVVAPAPLVVLTDDLPDGTVGVAYVAALEADGGVEPYTWLADAESLPLPEGLELTGEGVIEGTPVDSGDFVIEVIIKDAIGTEVRESVGLTVEILTATLSAAPQTSTQIGTEGFRLEFTTDASGTFELRSSVDLLAWSSLFSFEMLPGTTTLVDTNSDAVVHRFYQVWRVP